MPSWALVILLVLVNILVLVVNITIMLALESTVDDVAMIEVRATNNKQRLAVLEVEIERSCMQGGGVSDAGAGGSSAGTGGGATENAGPAGDP